MNPERRLAELGLVLPPVPTPLGNYRPWVLTGDLLYTAGLGPRRADGTFISGKLGADLDIAQGREAARLVGLNLLAVIRAALGSLDRVDQVVKTLGMVNATPDFSAHPKVIDGFADLFAEVFGPERGVGARSAVGMASLPSQIAVEVETIVRVRG